MNAFSDPTPVEEGMIPTPRQLLHRWDQFNDQQMLEVAEQCLALSQVAGDCFTMDHAGAMERVRPHRCPVPDVVGIRQIAERLEIKKGTVERWIERRTATGFPTPIAKVGLTDAYDMAAVHKWFNQWTGTRKQYYPSSDKRAKRCPDKGYCHGQTLAAGSAVCPPGTCLRSVTSSPFTSYGDNWPQEVVEATKAITDTPSDEYRGADVD